MNQTPSKSLTVTPVNFLLSWEGGPGKGKEKSEIPTQNNAWALVSFPFFSEMSLQFVFLESLFHYLMHKHEECAVIAMLFGFALYADIFLPLARNKKWFCSFLYCLFTSVKKFLLLIFFIALLVMQLSNKTFPLCVVDFTVITRKWVISIT